MLTVGHFCFLVAVLAATGMWIEWLVLWIFPLTFLFQSASLINYHSEHRWLVGRSTLPRRVAIARACVGRFCGDPCPDATVVAGRALWLGWFRWWLRLALIHLPHRLFILVGDQTQHDLHHRNLGSDWCNPAFARRDDVVAGARGWRGEGYIDVWGSMHDHLRFCIEEAAADGFPPAAEQCLKIY